MRLATTLPIVPKESVFPLAEPGVYRSTRRVKGQTVYYVIGAGGVVLDLRRVRRGETDAEVVSDLRTIWRTTERPVLTLLASGDVAVSAGFSPSPVGSLPRLHLLDPVPPR